MSPDTIAAKKPRLGFFSGRTVQLIKLLFLTLLFAMGWQPCAAKTVSALPDWLSREPLGESSSVNLYEAFDDDPINNWDYLGLDVGVRSSATSITGFELYSYFPGKPGTGYSLDRFRSIATTNKKWWDDFDVRFQDTVSRATAMYPFGNLSDLDIATAVKRGYVNPLDTPVLAYRDSRDGDLQVLKTGRQMMLDVYFTILAESGAAAVFAAPESALAESPSLVSLERNVITVKPRAPGLVFSGDGLLRLASPQAGAVFPQAAVNLNVLRTAYVAEVRALEEVGLAARTAGQDAEATARLLHQMRRDLGVQYKNLTPAADLERIYLRNINIYGDKLGPSIDYLRAQGKSWEQIIEGASRPGGKDLGL